MHRPLPRGPRGSTILEAVIVLVMLGLLSAVALPRFLSSRARAHQAEVRGNLKSWILAQRSFYEENARYEEDIRQLGFTVERGNRYAYYFGRGHSYCEMRDTAVAVIPQPSPGWFVDCIAVDRYVHSMSTDKPVWFTKPSDVTHTGEGYAPSYPGVTNSRMGWTPEGNISALAVGNIDQEAIGVVDTWYVSSADASVSPKCGDSKEHLEAGTPINLFDDVAHENFVGCR
jgi:type IV pilus assembly protein PilA